MRKRAKGGADDPVAGSETDNRGIVSERLAAQCRDLCGLVPSLNTPFAAGGGIDRSSLRRLVARTRASGASGALVMAVAGEGPALSLDEQALALEALSEAAQDRLPLVASVTAPDVASALARARLAIDAGVTRLCWQPGAGLTLDDLRAQLDRFGEAGASLVMIQDLDWSGPGLPLSTIEALFERAPLFRSIKIETVRAGPKYSEVLNALGGALHVAGGWAAGQMVEALDRGVHAFMPTAMDPLYAAVIAAHRSGGRDLAIARFETMLPVLAFTQQHIDVSIRFFKMLRRAQGVFATEECRVPPPLDTIQMRHARDLVVRVMAMENRFVDDEA